MHGMASNFATRDLISLLAAALLAAAHVAMASGQSPMVEVTGGRDASGQNYVWNIRNLSTQPIARVEIPHYNADMFEEPPGWEAIRENLQGIPGVKSSSGVCQTWTDDPLRQIRPGQTATIRMRINTDGVYRGRGEITVQFADGTRVRVGGVDLPLAPSRFEKLATPLGLAALVAIFAVVALRRKRAPAADGGAADGR